MAAIYPGGWKLAASAAIDLDDWKLAASLWTGWEENTERAAVDERAARMRAGPQLMSRLRECQLGS